MFMLKSTHEKILKNRTDSMKEYHKKQLDELNTHLSTKESEASMFHDKWEEVAKNNSLLIEKNVHYDEEIEKKEARIERLRNEILRTKDMAVEIEAKHIQELYQVKLKHKRAMNNIRKFIQMISESAKHFSLPPNFVDRVDEKSAIILKKLIKGEIQKASEVIELIDEFESKEENKEKNQDDGVA